MAQQCEKHQFDHRFKHSQQTGIAALTLAFLVVGSQAEEPIKGDSESWRHQQVQKIVQSLQKADSASLRSEYQARLTWLRRWRPGKMPPGPQDAPVESELVKEPLLEDLERPDKIDPNAWQQVIALQTRLLKSDTDEERKKNLPTTIQLASRLESLLAAQLPSKSLQLTSSYGWSLAYTRYRLGRALAYRELPAVRELWPISDSVRYEKQLEAVCQRLNEQTRGDRSEFILLQDRMLRRAGNKGRALELLEANQGSIELKWYLKKRRDLLKELGWDPPYREAARLYLQAGFSDEP